MLKLTAPCKLLFYQNNGLQKRNRSLPVRQVEPGSSSMPRCTAPSIVLKLSLMAILSFTPLHTSANKLEDSAKNTIDKLKSVLDNNWQITGFGTLGYTQTSKYDDRLFRRNVSQDGAKLEDYGWLVDSRLGLQVRGDLNKNWEVVFQGVLKEQYSSTPMDYIDMAFARYIASDNWHFTFGRQPFDLFLMSDHINVGYSHDFVRPPTEFYGYLPYESFDGVSIHRMWGDFDSEWSLDFSVGNLKEQFETESFDDDVSSDDDEDDSDDETRAEPIYNMALSWRSDHWHLRANFALLEFKLELGEARTVDEFVTLFSPIWAGPAQVRDAFLVNNKMRYFAVGGSWQSGDWKVQSEISAIDSEFAYYNGERAYLHLSKRFNDWLPYATFGYAHDNSTFSYERVEDLTLPPELEPLVPGLLAIQEEIDAELISLRTNQRSIGLGVRWDFSRQKALKFQCDKYWFDAGSGSIHGRKDNRYVNDESRSWCSLNLDWVF